MKTRITERIIGAVLAFVLFVGTFCVIGPVTDIKAATPTDIQTNAQSDVQYSATSIWSGQAAAEFAGGDGTKENPFIIATADQLYAAFSKITGTTQGVHSTESTEVAGGYQSGKILRQSSTTDYVAVYTPYYYKVADGVEAFYLNDIKGNETLSAIKALVSGSSKKDWKPGKSFVGNIDGNGVTIYGMYSSSGQGLVYKLDGSAVVKNFNFDSCYTTGSGNVAMVTTLLGSYNNDTTIITIANISVRNSHLSTKRNITVTKRTDNEFYQHNPGAAAIVATTNTCENLIIANCLFDGASCERSIGASSEITVDMIGGIVSGGVNMNNVTVMSAVALGAPITDEVYVKGKEAYYSRYDVTRGYPVYFYDCYSDVSHVIPSKYPGKYDKLLDIKTLSVKEKYGMQDMPALNWISDWELVSISDNCVIPMPKNNANVNANTSSYSVEIANQNNNGGAYSVFGGPYYQGTYGMYHTLKGAGTAEDPYIITNAFELARAIASGGMNVYNQVYYKLACNIDASSAKWISQDAVVRSSSTLYQYVPFSGVLDGDGHTVSGVYAGDDQTVGLIPVLAEKGVVKNLHVRNSCFVSGEGYAGAIAGETKIGAQVIGCSAEDCIVASASADKHIVGRVRGTVLKNSYYIASVGSTVETGSGYYNDKGGLGNIDVSKNSDVWYLGGKTGSTPKLKNFAAAQTFTDVDGDGFAEEYTARDLSALKNVLLSATSYKYLYADVNRDGQTDILDLVALCNEMSGDYSNPSNDFWRNVKFDKIDIYYGENDNYDAARKLELYLEEKVPGADVEKIVSADKTVSGTKSDSSAVYVHSNDKVGKPTGTLEIIVGNIDNYSAYSQNTLAINDYAITYDADKGVLWFRGGSFTGVEQAVLDFISGSAVETGKIYTVDNATLSPEKQAKKVMVDTNYDGKADTEKMLYYAWGDEFDGLEDVETGELSHISIDTWNHARMRTETEIGKTGNYNNVETANEKELDLLYYVKDGKLCITRGVKSEHATDVTDQLGYVRLENQIDKTALNDVIDDDDVVANPGLIKTNHSMLWKQGYAEMYGSLPSDGHTFASWWMLGHGNINNFAIDETLYAKVYKPNNTGEYAYDGTSTWPISTDPKTYKYQVPTNYFEIDIWELMQNNGIAHSNTQKSKLTGFYDYRLYLNVHKFYSVGARSQDVVNVIDWNNPGTPRATMQKDWFGSKEYYFSTSARYHDFTDGTTTRFTKNWLGRVTADYVESLQKQLTAPRRYGFYWSTNGVDKFNFTLYIYDINGDGVEDDNAILGTSDMTYNTDSGKNPQNYDCVNDAEVANQYMYFLIDNVLYSSNPNHSSSTADNAAMHTDMLTNEGTTANPDKIDLDMDYLRIYQYDGRRDIITRETEAFNNNNHFGY